MVATQAERIRSLEQDWAAASSARDLLLSSTIPDLKRQVEESLVQQGDLANLRHENERLKEQHSDCSGKYVILGQLQEESRELRSRVTEFQAKSEHMSELTATVDELRRQLETEKVGRATAINALEDAKSRLTTATQQLGDQLANTEGK